jgi:hypothetical protein
MKILLSMWLHPRMVAWFALTAFLGVAVRLPFARFQMIPHHLDFNPGAVLAPLSGVFFGPAGAWGSMAASLVADKLLGQWNGLSLFRALSFFFFALTAQKLWDFLLLGVRPTPPEATWTSALRYVFVSWVGALTAAAWQALGSELLRAYPFAYIFSLLTLSHLVFCSLLGVPLYLVMAREWVPFFGEWRGVMAGELDDGGTTSRNAALILIGAIGAPGAGLFISRAVYHIGMFQPFVLGAYTGFLVPLVVIPFLAAGVVGVFRSSSSSSSYS